MTDLLESDDGSIQHADGVRRAHAAQLACSTSAFRFQVITKPLVTCSTDYRLWYTSLLTATVIDQGCEVASHT